MRAIALAIILAGYVIESAIWRDESRERMVVVLAIGLAFTTCLIAGW